MRHPELPVFAFLTAALVLVPLSWHWRARNIATLAIIFWLFVVNVIYGVNSIIWAGNVIDSAPVWCDITTKLVVGASFALPLTMLCICKHLEFVSSSRKAHYDSSDRRRRIIFESILCFGVPLVFMALHYVVQGHRFDIFEDIGCQAALYISVPAIMIVWFPQLLFSIIALIYAAMALHHFMRRRLSFAAHLQNSNSALTTNRYLRLIAMAVTEMVWGTAFTAFNLYNNVSPGLRPWTTWGDVHSNFSRVDQYPTVTIPPHFLRIMMLFWWVMPASAIIFFVFFGFGEEARKEYLKVWTWFRTKILRRPAHVNSSSKISVKGGSTPRPLHLVGIKTSSTSSSDDHKPSLNTSSTFAFSPSVSNLAASSPRKLEEAESDTFTISSSYDSTNSPTGASHCISISNTLASHPITPLTSYTPYPESVYEATELDFAPTSVTSHRPFSPPSICPVSLSRTTAHPAENHDIQVTVHRQESVDHIA